LRFIIDPEGTNHPLFDLILRGMTHFPREQANHTFITDFMQQPDTTTGLMPAGQRRLRPAA
jgi:hypothetical protein